jgi:omega-6 fatty acid desaturase (delta-12 desaturase)
VIAIAVLAWAALHIETFLDMFNLPPVVYKVAQIALYAIYAICTSFPATGIWVIAHECGHQAFSASKTINNTVGWVLHSALLVPYHSWRISHGRHHASTGHLTRDEVFVPKTRKERGLPAVAHEGEHQGLNVPAFRQAELRDALLESPIASLWGAVLQQTFGWPMYLIRNASGQRHYPKGTNHFQPSSFIFKPSHFWQIIASDIGLLITLGVLYFWGTQRGFGEVARLYLPVYLLVNSHLVMITFLQHTDPILPHYSAKVWTFARGALATIDREMGWVERVFWHEICSSHVAHHVASRIPHYHGAEATKALKEFLGPHYQKSEENMLKAFWRVWRECLFIEDDADVAFFKNSSGVAQKVGIIEGGGEISDSGLDAKDN